MSHLVWLGIQRPLVTPRKQVSLSDADGHNSMLFFCEVNWHALMNTCSHGVVVASVVLVRILQGVVFLVWLGASQLLVRQENSSVKTIIFF